MQRGSLRFGPLGLLSVATLLACGARSALPGPSAHGGAPATSTGGGGVGGHGGTPPACIEGSTIECGSDVGACKKGLRTCHESVFGPWEGAIEPTMELCNGIDDNCDGQIDDGFHLGEPCDDPDADLCLDSVITCNGCSSSPNNIETCNGKDDNCNGIIDADCDVGDCQPSLEVTGSTPSDPGCIDLPVEKGSTGTIEYPCGGGPVTAQLGSIFFTGSVSGGVVSLNGTATFISDADNCLWKTDHHIGGTISSGQLSYSYVETLLDTHPWCWSPCTEVGTVKVTWAAAP